MGAAVLTTFGLASAVNHASADQVKQGDTLASIAAKNHTSVANLQRLNNLGDATIIYPGQDLKVSENTTNTANTNAQGEYVIQSGDTLMSIAQKFNTTVANLQALNNLGNNTMIYAGETLKVNGQAAKVQQVSTPQVAPQATPAPTNVAPAKPVAVEQQAPQNVQAAPQKVETKQVQNVKPQTNYQSNVGGDEAAAKNWIMSKESGGNYNARNGRYVGAFQLDSSYLNGDYSEANQNRVADQYVHDRYGSWTNAQAHWQNTGWY